MASKIKVVPSPRGYAEARKLKGVSDEIKRRVDAIAAAAGDGYVANVQEVGGNSLHSGRARGSVITDTPAAMRDQAKNQTLQRALSAGQ